MITKIISLNSKKTDLIDHWQLTASNDRMDEVQLFVKAFRTQDARNLVRDMMIHNYADAIMTYHPQKETLNRAEILKKSAHLVNTIFETVNELLDSPQYLMSFFSKISRNAKPQAEFWFPEYLEAYRNYRYTEKLNNRYKQLNPLIPGGSFVDIGCGGGELVLKFMNERNLTVDQAAGIDPFEWLSDGVKGKITFHQLDFGNPGTVSDKQYDSGVCLASIHHVGGRSDIDRVNTFIRGMASAIKPGGTLVVEEDVLVTGQDLQIRDWKRQTSNLRQVQPFYDRYLKFDQETQWANTALIDFFANILSVGEPDMPFPCGFRSISEWQELFAANGLRLKRVQFIGHMAHNFNQQSHAFFILIKP